MCNKQKGQKACTLCPLLFKIATKPISRVLSWTTIFLVCTLPCSSSHLLETAGPTYMFLHDVAPNRVYMAAQSPARRCALTAPFHPYLHAGGISLLHFPWGRPRRPLAVILALWSSDFPQMRPFGVHPQLSGLLAKFVK